MDLDESEEFLLPYEKQYWPTFLEKLEEKDEDDPFVEFPAKYHVVLSLHSHNSWIFPRISR